MRAESAVEPTRSENITVTWRRSAVSWGFGSKPQRRLKRCGDRHLQARLSRAALSADARARRRSL